MGKAKQKQNHGIGLKEIHLRDVGVYKELDIDTLDSEGFATICGKNLDSPNVKDNTNGVGKSLLFGAIPTLLYEADPLALKKKDKGNMLSKGSVIDLSWESPLGGIVRIEQTAKSYTVYYNGEDQKVGRQDVARSWIAKHWPLSKDEFYSYAYIQSQIPHPFQRAQPADRLKYLTSLFNLDVFDNIRMALKKKLDLAKDAETESKGLADMLDVTQRKQNALSIHAEEKNTLAKIIKQSDKMKARRNELSEQLIELGTQRSNARKYEKLKHQLDTLGIECSDLKGELNALRGELIEHDRYDDYVEALEEYQQELADVKKKIKALGDVTDLDNKKLRKEHGRLVKEEESLEALLEKVDEQQEEYDEWREALDKLSKKLSKLKAPKRTQEEAQDSRAEAKAIVQAYRAFEEHDHDGNSCPTCGQDVDLKAMARAATKAQAIIDECIEAIDYHKLNDQLTELKAEKVKKPKHKRKDLEKKLKAVGAALDAIEEQFETAKKYEKLVAKRDALKKPKAVKQPKKARKTIKNRIKDLEILKDLRAALKAVGEPEDPFYLLDGRYKKVSAEVEKLITDIEKKERKAQNIQMRIQEHEHYEETLRELRSKLADLQPLIDKRKVFEVLYKAYSNNALKLKAVEGRIKQIEKKLNEYSGLVFPEPMHFELFTTKQGIGATVTRLVSKKTTDIAIMSGAETNCFRLLFAVAIMPFIPANRRTNFIVLDEPENSCSDATRDHIVKNFLPILKQIIPNVYWITPLDVEHFSDNQWTITKQGGVSKLTRKVM
ncbi:putative exonuclease [Dickeya phage vB_DsoM_AD1]|uniref:Putative exonuclease n=1 Tax=Dickeya phage vB_DsoM_AD1 TaxID=2283029 RepID=A0A384ZYA1_9CAUD|nr:putative exonuclease [Dickeya phage vB_DsoM_AD1]AXG67243.1 putative exonuclease [Dickeya phage vB_DsoM_AD1]